MQAGGRLSSDLSLALSHLPLPMILHPATPSEWPNSCDKELTKSLFSSTSDPAATHASTMLCVTHCHHCLEIPQNHVPIDSYVLACHLPRLRNACENVARQPDDYPNGEIIWTAICVEGDAPLPLIVSLSDNSSIACCRRLPLFELARVNAFSIDPPEP
jgi:hypothetical protein